MDNYQGITPSDWLIEDNQVVLNWGWGLHHLTQVDDTKDWLMLSRDPPSKLEWVGPNS